MRRARALIGDGAGGATIREIIVPEPVGREVLVSIAAAGLCRTDLDALRWPGPLVIGHEGAGVVEAVGSDVDRVRVGDPVALNWAIPCGRCPQCRRGAPFLCAPSTALLGNPLDAPARPRPPLLDDHPVDRMFELGAFSDYVLVDQAAVNRVPAALDPGEAAIIGCAVLTGWSAVRNVANVEEDSTVVVVGCGGVGLNAVLAAAGAGVRAIVAIDRDPGALALARRFGATHAMLMAGDAVDLERLVAPIRDILGGEGADHVFEATGRPELAFAVLGLARLGGVVVQMSGFEPGQRADVPLDLFLWNKRYQVALYGGCAPDRDIPLILAEHARGLLPLGEQIGTRIRLEDLPGVMAAPDGAARGRTVVVFEP